MCIQIMKQSEWGTLMDPSSAEGARFIESPKHAACARGSR